MCDEVYIVSACRTAIGSLLGQYSKVPATQLGKIAIEGCLSRAGVTGSSVSEVVMGNVLTAGQGQNPARQSALNANIPIETPASTVNVLCGSGLKSVSIGYNSLRLRENKIVIAGGQENMTLAQHSMYLRDGYKLGNASMTDTLLHDGLTDAFNNVHMGLTVEHCAKKYNKSREEQDQFALKSQAKASIALAENYFQEEIVPVPHPKTKEPITIDEFVKKDTTIESLGKLRPAFDKQGTVTAGNASGINDGAAAVLLASGTAVSELKLKPLAKIIGMSEVGCEPMEMGISPIKAVQKLISNIGWSIDDVDLFEINEAFAAQSIIVLEGLKLDEKKVNISGGAIALGHPIGASGTRVLVTLIYNLKRTKGKKGIASLCVGGGMGIAIAIEI